MTADGLYRIGPCYTHKAGVINYEYLYPLHGIGIIELPISNHYLWSCGERVFSITDHRVYKVGLTSRGLSLNETHAISLSISALYHVDVGHRTLCLLDLSLSLSLCYFCIRWLSYSFILANLMIREYSINSEDILTLLQQPSSFSFFWVRSVPKSNHHHHDPSPYFYLSVHNFLFFPQISDQKLSQQGLNL